MTKQERLKEMKAGVEYYKLDIQLMNHLWDIVDNEELDADWTQDVWPHIEETAQRKAKLEARIKELENETRN